MIAKHVILIAAAAVLLIGFAGFVLFAAVLLQIGGDAEIEAAGTLIIAVRHKLLYEQGETISRTQCVAQRVGLCRTPATLNAARHRVEATECKIIIETPQPFLSEPEISQFAVHDFALEPNKTYYWYLHLEKSDECSSWLPAEYANFKTGEIKLAARETKRIEIDFTN